MRDYHFKLIEELAERYDFDGLELDWMRFGFHFRPGHEAEGARLLTEFTAQVRAMLDRFGQRRGHRIRLGARVPSRPQTALGLGMDAVTWAQLGLVDWLVVTPFWATAETDMPIELWRQLLAGAAVTLCAGLEVLLRPTPDWPSFQTNSLETARGAAASLLDRGADRIYLFNYMDSQTAIDDLHNYPALLREVGRLDSIEGKPRRHVLTYADTWAVGEPRALPLPATISAGRRQAFRLHIGPKPEAGRAQLALGLETGADLSATVPEARVNGEPCPYEGMVQLPKPSPDCPACTYAIPLSTLQRGYNVIEVLARADTRITWVELDIS